MNYETVNGINKYDEELSYVEFSLFREFENILINKEFTYLSMPSSVSKESLLKQGINVDALFSKSELYPNKPAQVLTGSAEQGILNYFSNSVVSTEKFIFCNNQCFRGEEGNYSKIRNREFKKIEMFCFTAENAWQDNFYKLLSIAIDFLEKHRIIFKVVDKTGEEGYHLFKSDIEVYTKEYGWLETHSCAYFGDNQVSRYNIQGGIHTISCTGLASPRILIPFIDRRAGLPF
jgi:seryl-tRNA synthetase